MNDCPFCNRKVPSHNDDCPTQKGRASVEAILSAEFPVGRPAEDAQAPAAKGMGSLTDAERQELWNEACKDTPENPGWCRHLRFARAIESRVHAGLKVPAALTDAQAHAILMTMAREADDWAERLAYDPSEEEQSGKAMSIIMRELGRSAARESGVSEPVDAPAFTVSVNPLKASNGVTYVVCLKRADGETVTPINRNDVDEANTEGFMWSEFLGVPFDPCEAAPHTAINTVPEYGASVAGVDTPIARVGVGPFAQFHNKPDFAMIEGVTLPDGVHDLYTRAGVDAGEKA